MASTVQPLGAPRLIRFATGHREKFWEKNCVAIGLSVRLSRAARIDVALSDPPGHQPLHRIVSRCVPAADLPRRIQPLDAQGFRAGARPARLPLPRQRARRAVLAALPEHRHSGSAAATGWRCFPKAVGFLRHEGELFPNASWVAVMLGQGVIPRVVDPLVATPPVAEIEAKLALLRAGDERLCRHVAFARRSAADVLRLAGCLIGR